ncbi:MAG: type II toxin-antitoxin system HicA family toxin [Candidatus Poribacteria bacterium]|nr:type II toxin-antitoxin system HicA family toxin [Candidatus Poribacteria bacterium]MDE0398105.1 type II toxin-antitoxin system HicA family toxin [Candidatus Poribacteria bacterium]
MNRSEALLRKARQNPNGLKFREFERLMRRSGWTQHRQRGSHRTWYSPKGYRIIVQPDHSMAKGYQVRQFLRQYNEEAVNEER